MRPAAIGLAMSLLFGGAALAQPPARSARPGATPASTQAAPVRAAAEMVDLNLASEDQLERLPGIGPTRARAIVEHRRTHPFRHVDEVTKVKGIGRKTFARLRPYLKTGAMPGGAR